MKKVFFLLTTLLVGFGFVPTNAAYPSTTLNHIGDDKRSPKEDAEGIQFTETSWKEILKKAKAEKKVIFLDAYASWCGPCRQIGPALEELATEYDGKVKIVKVNVDENPDSPAQLGVRGIPALFLFKDGQVVSNKIGAAPKAALKAWIDENV